MDPIPRRFLFFFLSVCLVRFFFSVFQITQMARPAADIGRSEIYKNKKKG